jgi:hypothetical protein
MVTKKLRAKANPNDDPFFLKMFFAGVACVCAGTVTHPVDLIKTRMQIFGEVGGQGKRDYGGYTYSTRKKLYF